ncbi:MAG: LytTR family DNA-binding domain-containing protein [Vicinamibacterales bacterium]|jgi:two-component system LytT family response regulator/two-component system response regulator LytT|nr:DNA-binding response regulator [Acidobacteriota bacterium]MDP7294997.1 LytTR family DNA-binding domain-containing protein [Vicinamibacterales bacterium]MDP7472032.1 LytTR family DNA-binding domain-containing protein [Vicinamibacterales bacterium]MDP7671674.1 LytTR family DNA-binding domain-containing protein [Vicinamibacterales bacterium]HJO39177.1 LytTR family DNA-binding domain-containing protein [Vicinamibacterales bacterium]|tara:strand:+ start:647 stop:1420 length:774 start_codon:yes stop_codon:yes gene_type:complete
MDLRTVVVDDEQLAREELCFLLEQFDDLSVIGQAGDGPEALRIIGDLDPDVVFLDVQMPGLTGFQVARELLTERARAQIVFVTAYDQHALEAFEVNAVDYLLKPVEASRLAKAVDRVRSRPQTPAPGLAAEDLERLVDLVAQKQNRRDRVAVKVDDRFVLVKADDIIYVSLIDDAITIVTANLVGTSNHRTLDELQANLDPAIFWRVHRSHVVNINKVKEIVPWFSRNYILKMKDAKATEIPVSRAQTKRLRDYLSL